MREVQVIETGITMGIVDMTADGTVVTEPLKEIDIRAFCPRVEEDDIYKAVLRYARTQEGPIVELYDWVERMDAGPGPCYAYESFSEGELERDRGLSWQADLWGISPQDLVRIIYENAPN